MRFILCTLLCMPFIASAYELNTAARVVFDGATTRSDGSVLDASDIARTVTDISTSGGTQQFDLEAETFDVSVDVQRSDILDDGQFTMVFEVYHIDTDGRIGDKAERSVIVPVSQALIDEIEGGMRPGRVINLDIQVRVID